MNDFVSNRVRVLLGLWQYTSTHTSVVECPRGFFWEDGEVELR